MVPALRKQPGTDEQNSGGSDVGTTVPNSPDFWQSLANVAWVVAIVAPGVLLILGQIAEQSADE
jgi:hypothetical protein